MRVDRSARSGAAAPVRPMGTAEDATTLTLPRFLRADGVNGSTRRGCRTRVFPLTERETGVSGPGLDVAAATADEAAPARLCQGHPPPYHQQLGRSDGERRLQQARQYVDLRAHKKDGGSRGRACSGHVPPEWDTGRKMKLHAGRPTTFSHFMQNTGFVVSKGRRERAQWSAPPSAAGLLRKWPPSTHPNT